MFIRNISQKGTLHYSFLMGFVNKFRHTLLMSQIIKEVWINIGHLESIRKLFLSNLCMGVFWENIRKIDKRRGWGGTNP